MHKTISFGLRKLFEIISSDEVLNQLGLNHDDKLILKGYWVDKKTRINIANELNFKPNSVSRRYTKLIHQIREKLQNLVIDFNYYKQRTEKLEQVKQEYINFHIEKTGIYPEFMIWDDLIEHVSMSQRLQNRLSERGINRMRDLRNFTKTDLLKGRYFGNEALNELEGIMIKYDVCLKED